MYVWLLACILQKADRLLLLLATLPATLTSARAPADVVGDAVRLRLATELQLDGARDERCTAFPC